MTTRRLNLLASFTFAALAAYGAACSSDSTPPKDGGTDAPAGDAPTDRPADGGADGVTFTDAGGSDAGLTAKQARGKYLVDHVIACGDCHTPQTPTGPDMSKYLAGNPNFVALPNGDKLGSRNLTNHETGLKNRSDDEIKAMFMDGKRPVATGAGGTEALNPIMPYYVFHNMKSDDADAIVAYLRVVPGVQNEIPRRSAAFDVPQAAAPIDMNTVPLPENSSPAKESALRGRYLATQTGLCIECHTKHVMGGPSVLDATKYFQGGEDFTPFFAATLMIRPVSKNLTSDVATGLGTWSAADIVKVLKMGKAKDGSGICPPMPVGPMGAYGGLTAEDADDIANYIKSLPAATNAIVDMCVFPPPPPPGDGGAGDGAASEGGTTTDGGATADGATGN